MLLVYIREQPTCALPAFHQTSARGRDPEKKIERVSKKNVFVQPCGLPAEVGSSLSSRFASGYSPIQLAEWEICTDLIISS